MCPEDAWWDWLNATCHPFDGWTPWRETYGYRLT